MSVRKISISTSNNHKQLDGRNIYTGLRFPVLPVYSVMSPSNPEQYLSGRARQSPHASGWIKFEKYFVSRYQLFDVLCWPSHMICTGQRAESKAINIAVLHSTLSSYERWLLFKAEGPYLNKTNSVN